MLGFCDVTKTCWAFFILLRCNLLCRLWIWTHIYCKHIGSLKATDKNLTTLFTLYSSIHQWKLHFNGRRTNNQRLISGGKRNSTKSTLRRSFDQISFVTRAQYLQIKSISVWNYLFFQITKGQLISKCLFGVFTFFQKTNENKSTWGSILVKSNSFLHFLEEIDDPKKPFRN